VPKSANILVVEDNKELAKSLSVHLTAEGYAITETHNGEDAVAHLRKAEFAIVVLDLKLPKLSGFEVLKFAKKNSPQTKVIVLTAYADPMNITMCKELGSDEVIAKPYDLAFLFDRIRSFLKK
jgi:DNA-binding response OmpR family regulator